MSDAAVYLLLPEGMADWEPGYAVAGLHHWAKVPVRTVGFTRAPITTMGGLRVLPDISLAELPAGADAVRLFLLPGGDLWEGDYPSGSLEPVLRTLDAANIPIAAICGATIAVARAGLLRGRRHTSNGADYLAQFAPGTTVAADYVEELATRDRGVITASGLGPVEFAHEIFAELGVFSPAELAEFLELYKYGRMPHPSPGPAAWSPMATVDDLSSQRLYHGTKADLKPGDLIEPGYNSNYGKRKAAYVYLTATLDAATWGAELALGEGSGRVYMVEPTGTIEDDPNLTDKRYPGNPTKSYRSRDPLRVTGEVTDWQGHSAEELKAMKDHLERLKRLGVEAIED